MSFFKKNPVSDKEIAFQRLEMKVNALMAICVVQMLMLAALLFAKMFVPSTFTVLLVLVILGVVGYLFRQQLPSILGTVFRLVTRSKNSASSGFTATNEFKDVEKEKFK
jgi:hypothetical protein